MPYGGTSAPPAKCGQPVVRVLVLQADDHTGDGKPSPYTRGRRACPGLSKIRSIRSTMTCGSAACCAERLRLSEGRASPTTSSEQAGRLSLPACSEEDGGSDVGRKAGGFPHSGAAEPR